MRFTSALFVGAALFGAASASPLKRTIHSPADNGFPSPNQTQLNSIEGTAKGPTPNSALPPTLKNDSLAGVHLLQLAEEIETFFFTELVHNITSGVEGYNLSVLADRVDPDYLLRSFKQARATETVHALTLGAIASNVNATRLEPCGTYTFPVTNIHEALNLAILLTTTSYGVLSDVGADLAGNGDIGLIRALTQTAASEGEQGGFYRYVAGLTPEGTPFSTEVSRSLAFTALSGFVDLSSCPNINLLAKDLVAFPALSIVGASPSNKDTNFTLSVAADDFTASGSNNTAYAVITNQINVPYVQKIQAVPQGDSVQFNVNWPFTEQHLNGLSVITITNSPGPFADIDAVDKATIFGPQFIIAN